MAQSVYLVYSLAYYSRGRFQRSNETKEDGLSVAIVSSTLSATTKRSRRLAAACQQRSKYHDFRKILEIPCDPAPG